MDCTLYGLNMVLENVINIIKKLKIKDKWFSHLAIEVPGENTSNEWCEKVTNEEYDKL